MGRIVDDNYEMTNQEAIEILGGIRACYNLFDEYDEPKYAALSKAIFALKDEPTKNGRWYGDTCSVCGFSWCDVTYEAPQTEMPFCPNCGAKMCGKDSEEQYGNFG